MTAGKQSSGGKLLLLTSEFPPLANAGVQRALYFAKYLPLFGWVPLVLTVKDVTHFSYDYSLLAKLPEDCRVYRTESFELRRLLWLLRRALRRNVATPEPSQSSKPADRVMEYRPPPRLRNFGRTLRRWLFVPDDRIMWTPFATVKALKLVRNEDIDLVFATLPVCSTGVTALIISKLTRLPLIIDMRDPWIGDPYSYAQEPTALHRRLNLALERATLKHAAKIIVICLEMKNLLHKRYPDLPQDKVVVITNGFDREEFASASMVNTGEKFTVVYSGALYAHHSASFGAFCDAWSRACALEPEFAEQAQFWVAGRVDPELKQIAAEWPALKVKFLGQQPHTAAISYLVSANLLLLLIKNFRPTADTVITIPGKAFEYLASGAPILMIGPEGDAARLIRTTGSGNVYNEADTDLIANDLLGRYREFKQKTASSPLLGDRMLYDRKALTRRLANELDEVCRVGPSSSCASGMKPRPAMS